MGGSAAVRTRLQGKGIDSAIQCATAHSATKKQTANCIILGN